MPDKSIIDRLRAALDQAQTLAEKATPGPWHNDGPDTIAEFTVYDSQWSIATATTYDHNEPLSNKPGATGPGYIDPNANAAHIAAWSPDRVLRLIASHRQLLNAYTRADEAVAEHVGECGPDRCDHHDYTAAVATSETLRDVITGAAAFWLGEDTE